MKKTMLGSSRRTYKESQMN